MMYACACACVFCYCVCTFSTRYISLDVVDVTGVYCTSLAHLSLISPSLLFTAMCLMAGRACCSMCPASPKLTQAVWRCDPGSNSWGGESFRASCWLILTLTDWKRWTLR